MRDRLPTQVLPNGAVRMEQFDANGNSLGYIYIKRADEPIEEGTPYNVNNVLTDETADALGVASSNPTPNEAFAKIAEALTNPNLVVARGQKLYKQDGTFLDIGDTKVANGDYVGNGKHTAANKITINLDFKPLYVFVSRKNQSEDNHILSAVYGMTKVHTTGVMSNVATFEWGEKSVSWWIDNPTYGPNQMQNEKGIEYVWFVLGINNEVTE